MWKSSAVGLLVLSGCAHTETPSLQEPATPPVQPTSAPAAVPSPAPAVAPPIDLAQARRFMRELDQACAADGGARAPRRNEVNSHLDTKDARVLMQLEWNALEAALGAAGEKRTRAIRDALAFRAARQARFPQARVREAGLETNEGLAEYTGARLAGYAEAEIVKTGRERRERETGFVRSFAYVSGPLYGYLLDGFSTDWRRRVTSDTDLGALLAEVTKTSPSKGSVLALGAPYDGAALLATEEARAKKRDAQIAGWRKALVDGPVLVVPLEGASGTFDPRRVFPISETETVYTSRTLRGSWGSLEVDEAPMLEDGAKRRATVSLEGAAADGSHGTSWTLKLAPGWTTVPGSRRGDLTIVEKR